MKKHTKQLLGACGLVLVAGMTIVAAQLPNPNAAATNSVTDRISIRVVNPNRPDANFTAPENGLVTREAAQTLNFDYSAAFKVTLSLTHTDADGNQIDYGEIWSVQEYGVAHSQTLDVNLANYGTGYGAFNYTLRAYDEDGVLGAETSLLINRVATVTNITMDEDGTLNFDNESNADVDYIELTVTNEETGKSHTVRIPGGADSTVASEILKELGGDGNYTITIASYNANSKLLSKTIRRIEVVGVPKTAAPDTGGLFQNLNIAREDYLVTGVLVFLVIAVVAAGIIMRTRKTKTSVKRK